MELPDKFAALGLTYDDVLLLPGESDLAPQEIDTSSRLTREISLKVPLVSAAMDTVTESRMAIAMARQGGLGVLHRNLSLADQAYQVDLVKRTQTGIISNPVTIGPDATLEDLDRICGEYRVSGLPVVDTDNRLMGIITNRDLRFTPVAEWATTKVDEVMTPMPLVTGAVGISRDEATTAAAQAQARAAAAGRRRRAPRRPDHGQGLREVRAVPARLQGRRTAGCMVGAAIGYFGDAWERATTLVEAGVDVLVADTAHGHVRMLLDMVARLKNDPATRHIQVIGGNVADPRGSPGVRRRGRRRREGRLRPRLDLHDPRGHGLRRTPGDRGVRSVPGLPARRCPGHRRRRPPAVRRHREGDRGRRRHRHDRLAAGGLRGVAGRADLRQRQAVQVLPRHGLDGARCPRRGKKSYSKDRYFQAEVTSDDKIVPEGIEGQVAYRGPLAAVAHQLIGGLSQSMFYVGARTVPELQEKGRFIRITSASLKESHPHDVQMTVEAPNYSGR